MFKFDKMHFHGFGSRNLVFKSDTSEGLYYVFEFSLAHLRYIFSSSTTKWFAKLW